MQSLQSQFLDYSATLDRLNELKLSRRSLKYLEVVFKVTFSLALPSWLLKFPNINGAIICLFDRSEDGINILT